MSVITDDTPAAVEAYLAAVRANLSDLPPAERDDLLAEVEASLREAADDTGSIGARLGSPEEFAAELRSAAGLHESSTAISQPTIKETFERLLADPRVAAVRRLGVELAPVWWVVRGYLAVADSRPSGTHPGRRDIRLSRASAVRSSGCIRLSRASAARRSDWP